MDIEAAERLLQRLEGEALADLTRVLSGMNGTVQHVLTVWHGPDAQLFEQEWAQHASNLTLLKSAIEDLGGSLGRSISEQRAASEI
jgi:uncharacterized protein YukE